MATPPQGTKRDRTMAFTKHTPEKEVSARKETVLELRQTFNPTTSELTENIQFGIGLKTGTQGAGQGGPALVLARGTQHAMLGFLDPGLPRESVLFYRLRRTVRAARRWPSV